MIKKRSTKLCLTLYRTKTVVQICVSGWVVNKTSKVLNKCSPFTIYMYNIKACGEISSVMNPFWIFFFTVFFYIWKNKPAKTTWAHKQNPAPNAVVGLSVSVITHKEAQRSLNKCLKKPAAPPRACGCNSWVFRAESLHGAAGEKLKLQSSTQSTSLC